MGKKEILAFIKSKKHAVIATCMDNQPEAALVGFGESDDFILIFGTSKKSRKYKNLKRNGKVAVVIGWDEDWITVQYEGVAYEIYPSDWKTYTSFYYQKVPEAKKYESYPDQTYFKVEPTWIRYSDLSGEEEKIIELKNF